MSTFTSITVSDREDTPVSHVFTPNFRTSAGVFEWTERTGVPLGDSKLTISSSETAAGNHKIRIRLQDPVVVNETINGVVDPKVARTSYASLEFTFSNRSTEQERENMIGMIADMLASEQTAVMQIARDLVGIY